MRGTKEISTCDDIIDSRDVIDRIAYLEDELGDTYHDEEQEDEAEECRELRALKALDDEASGYTSDWKYGAALIRDSYFEEYAQQLAEDIGAISSDMQWPLGCIDWEKAADELKQDYTAVDFDGTTYWTR